MHAEPTGPQARPLHAPARLVYVLIALYVFAVSVTLMGSSFKALAKGTAESFLEWASHPVVALFVGVFMTALVQSSSTVTTMIVTAVAGQLITVQVAVPMVMGANIGTTVTNTLVALGSVVRSDEFRRSMAAATVHDFFNFIAVAILFPTELAVQGLGVLKWRGMAVGPLGWIGEMFAHVLEGAGVSGVEKGKFGFGFIMKGPATVVENLLTRLLTGGEHLTAKALSKAAAAADAAAGLKVQALWCGLLGVIVGLVALSACLVVISKNMRVVVLGRMGGALGERILRSPAACVALGLVLTVLVQSSSITTSLLVPMAAAGLLAIRQVFFVTLGANVGTTCTGLLAALFLAANGESGADEGLAIALVHLCFNLLGIVIILSIPGLRGIPIRLAEGLARACVERRRYAIIYLVGAFFVLPGICMAVYRGIEALTR